MGRLFVGVGELDQIAVIVRPSDEANAGWQVVAGESRGNDDGRNIDQKSVEMRRAFLVDEGRVDTVANQGWLMLDGFMHDGVELVVGHDHEKIGH